MKRALLCLVITFTSVTAYAEDSIVIWGNYYKERSTRVIEPTIAINKELPHDISVDAGYLVDQVTSASGAFTSSDAAFSEYRHDVRLGVRQKYLGFLKPGVRIRYSHEPDYDSLSLGADLELSLDRDNSILGAFITYQTDDVRTRRRMGESERLVDVGELHTVAFGVAFTQVLDKNLLAGVSLEMQVLNGFQENTYRVESHPDGRKRRSLGAWVAYHADPTNTTTRVFYRLYGDNWHLVGHTIELEVTQSIVPALDVIGRFRYYAQNDVYFVQPIAGYTTADPKLMKFNSQFYELGLRWTMTALEGGALDMFSRSRIQPSYGYLNQHNRYLGAHLVQIGWFWPF